MPACPARRLTALAIPLAVAAASAAAAQAPTGPAPERAPLVAVLPVQNLTGGPIRAVEVRRTLCDALSARGVTLLDEGTLRPVLDRHRVRYTGGLYPELATALRDEAGASAVLITSVESLEVLQPPLLTLSSRLVSTAPTLDILWMDGAALSGNDRFGILGLNLVDDPQVLLDDAARRLADSLSEQLAGRPAPTARVDRRFRPGKSFLHPEGVVNGTPARIAVLPFTNRSERQRAGDLVALHLVRRLADRPEVVVVEPGLVRQVLLVTRLIPEGGIAYTQADILRETLGVDLVVTGDVLDYVESQGENSAPVVDFTVQVLDARRRRVAWSSFSHHTGDDRVWLFDRGRLRTAGALASEMSLAIVDALLTTGTKPPVAQAASVPARGIR